MKKPPVPIRPFDIVVCTWEDAWAASSTQAINPADAMSTYVPAVRRSVGFWVGQSRDVVILASDDDRTISDQNKPSECLGGLMYIPKKMVREIIRVAAVNIKAKK